MFGLVVQLSHTWMGIYLGVMTMAKSCTHNSLQWQTQPKIDGAVWHQAFAFMSLNYGTISTLNDAICH
jgi:hypothetical protein